MSEYEDKLTALIAAHNDAYALDIMLDSLHSHVDEVLVLEDHSTDMTLDVAHEWCDRTDNVTVTAKCRHEPQTPLYALRNQLLGMSDARHVLCLDSDMVLVERNAHLLREWCESDVPAVGLCQCQLWGDFRHVARHNHYDRSHCYIDRAVYPDFEWEQTPAGFLKSGVHLEPSGETMVFHLNGVRPDHRLVSRLQDRKFFTGKQNESPAQVVDAMGDDYVHEAAMKRLRKMARSDKFTMAYAQDGTPLHDKYPQLPRAIQERMPGRFEVVYEDGAPVDRIDHWRSQ